jgi:hypothetical protein
MVGDRRADEEHPATRSSKAGTNATAILLEISMNAGA